MTEKSVLIANELDVGGVKYDVDWSHYPEGTEDLKFVRSLFEQVLPELQVLLSVSLPGKTTWFTVGIGERHLGPGDIYTYQLEVKSSIDERYAEFPSVACRTKLSLVQYYFARCLTDYLANYAGRLEVRLSLSYLAVRLPVEDEQVILRRMMRTIFTTYYEQIVKSYPEWKTDYLDAPMTI